LFKGLKKGCFKNVSIPLLDSHLNYTILLSVLSSLSHLEVEEKERSQAVGGRGIQGQQQTHTPVTA